VIGENNILLSVLQALESLKLLRKACTWSCW